MIKISPQEFQVFARYIKEISGLSLDASKVYLIESRLKNLLMETQCSSFSELYHKAKSDPSNGLKRKIINAVTTGETQFFRDTYPFELLQYKILPDLIDKKNKEQSRNMPINIRIWSAASSTGQEIYSIAIVLKSLLNDLSNYRIRLLGTDISDEAIRVASRGIYSNIEIERGMPKEILTKYFTMENMNWKIKDEIRAMVLFKTLNLMEDFTSLGRFDIVFCRNVAIYFSEEDKISLFSKIENILDPDGYLIIGSTESITSICPQFESKRYLRSIFYQKKRISLY
ncbi:MAG: CheR family methyltransferase [bacterium]